MRLPSIERPWLLGDLELAADEEEASARKERALEFDMASIHFRRHSCSDPQSDHRGICHA